MFAGILHDRGHVRVPIRFLSGRTQFILSHIAGKDGRLVREQEKPLEQFGLRVADIQGERRFALVQMRQQPVNQRDFCLRFRIPHPRFFLLGRALLLQSGQICQDQLRRNRLDVPHRINRAGHMVDVAILKTADHLNDGIHLANMTEKLISQSLALARPFDQTCDIHKFDRRRDDFLGFRQLSQYVEPLIRHGHVALVRLDSAKWIICRLRLAGAGHGIEEGGLSDIGQTDDSGLEHRRSP